jgi:hypothetical protein
MTMCFLTFGTDLWSNLEIFASIIENPSNVLNKDEWVIPVETQKNILLIKMWIT